MTKRKHDTGWAIVDGGLWLPFTTRATRRQAIQDYSEDHVGEPWADLRRGGCRVVKINVEFDVPGAP